MDIADFVRHLLQLVAVHFERFQQAQTIYVARKSDNSVAVEIQRCQHCGAQQNLGRAIQQLPTLQITSIETQAHAMQRTNAVQDAKHIVDFAPILPSSRSPIIRAACPAR